MFENKTRILLILPQVILDGVRVFAGKATAALKLSVSVQIVLRALIEEGLKRDGDRGLLANIEGQAQAVRRIRSLAGRGGRADAERRNVRSEFARGAGGRRRGIGGSAEPATRGIGANAWRPMPRGKSDG